VLVPFNSVRVMDCYVHNDMFGLEHVHCTVHTFSYKCQGCELTYRPTLFPCNNSSFIQNLPIEEANFM